MLRSTTNLERIHQARIQNAWPRPGMTENSAIGSGLLGRFVGHKESWQFEDGQRGLALFGQGDPIAKLNSILKDITARVGSVEAGAIGYVGYEWGSRRLAGQRSHDATDYWCIPDIQFLLFEKLSHPQPHFRESHPFLNRTYSRTDLDSLVQHGNVRTLVSKSRYLADIAKIQEHIDSGDIYQANYTQMFELQTKRSSAENSDQIAKRLQAPYSAYLKFGPSSISSHENAAMHFPEVAVMTASPERFWRLRDGMIDSRPIKGTVGRAGSPSEDRGMRRLLLSSKKDRAELLMITDLVRNDLGQVADIGSVRTDALVRIRPTPSVWHLESTVTGRLDPSKSWVDVMRALHPAGSISGTPKRRAVEILNSLESVSRGPYCGAIGWVDAKGNADFAVGIRTCIQIGETIRIHSGGGIVADSDPEAEYYESLIKIAPLLHCLSSSPNDDCGPLSTTMKERNA